MSNPLVSIIIPIYNTGLLLDECLNSIYLQEYNNVEILICDDYSTDILTIDIIEKWKKFDKRFRVISAEKKGANYAREIGVKIASGDYIVFVDSDDRLEINAVEKLVLSALKYDADMVIGKLVRTSLDGKILNKNISPIPNIAFKKLTADNVLDYFKYFKPTLCGKLYKKHLFDNLEIENPPFFQDWNISYKIVPRISKVAFLNETVYLYTYIENSFASYTSTTNKKNLHKAFISIEGIINHYKKNDLKEYCTFLDNVVFHFLISVIGRSHHIESRRERLKHFRECKTFWKANNTSFFFLLQEHIFWKIIFSNFIFSEISRIYFLIRHAKG